MTPSPPRCIIAQTFAATMVRWIFWASPLCSCRNQIACHASRHDDDASGSGVQRRRGDVSRHIDAMFVLGIPKLIRAPRQPGLRRASHQIVRQRSIARSEPIPFEPLGPQATSLMLCCGAAYKDDPVSSPQGPRHPPETPRQYCQGCFRSAGGAPTRYFGVRCMPKQSRWHNLSGVRQGSCRA